MNCSTELQNEKKQHLADNTFIVQVQNKCVFMPTITSVNNKADDSEEIFELRCRVDCL